MIKINHNLKIDSQVQESVSLAANKVLNSELKFVSDFNLNTQTVWDRFKLFFKSNNYKNIVWCGTGGSYLAAKIISDTMGSTHKTKKIYFLENLDAYKVESVLSEVDKDNTLFVFASKSGRTADVLILKKLIENRFKNLRNNSLVLTQASESPLRKWAESSSDILIQDLPTDICGRFSAFTAIGLLALVFYSEDELESWIRGATWSLAHQKIIIQLCEYYQQSLINQKWISVFWVYSSVFNQWGRWAQQLWAESLSKNNTEALRASTPLAALGSLDQHSLLQQFSDGFNDKSYTFLTFNYPKQINEDLYVENLGVEFSEILRVQAESTFEALGSQPKLMLNLEHKNSSSLSALFMTYQLVVPVMAELLRVNPYNQPGVEKSKLIARKKLGY